MGEILHKNIGSTGALALQLLEGNDMVIDIAISRKDPLSSLCYFPVINEGAFIYSILFVC